MEDVSMASSSQSHITNPEADATQSTQPAYSQEAEDTNDCWGLLIPASGGAQKVRLLRTQAVYTIGRRKSSNLCLDSNHISSDHATITWNSVGGDVLIHDHSSNGTWLGNDRIGKNNTRVLEDGMQITFGPKNYIRKEGEPAPSIYMFCDLLRVKRAIHKHYDLDKELGVGNFAVVYRALSRRNAKWVAVKVISQVRRYAGSARDGLDEIGILQNLRHTNIVQLLEHFENSDDSLDLVFELVEGGDLDSYIRKYNGGVGGLSEGMTRHLADQICAGTAFIHSNNITHRDLKPENILLTVDDPPKVKIADFGVAKLTTEGTDLKTICGTLQYMAPEILSRLSTDPPYTHRVDSWSIGCLIFTMFTTHVPWPPSNDSPVDLRDLMAQRGIAGIQWDFITRKNLSKPARQFLDSLLMFNPDQRLDLSKARSQPWMSNFKRAYVIDADTGDLTRSLSWRDSTADFGKTISSPNDLVREKTVDPYENENEEEVHQHPVAGSSLDPYADPPMPIPLARPPRQKQLPDIAEVSADAAYAPATRNKGKGKAKAQTSDLVPAPDSANSSAYLYGNTGAAPSPLDPVPEVEEMQVDRKTAKRKRDHGDNVVALAMGGDSLSSLSSMSSDGEPAQPELKPAASSSKTRKTAAAAAARPPPAKRGRIAEPEAVIASKKPPSTSRKPPSAARAPRKPPPLTGSKPPSTRGRKRATTADPETEEPSRTRARR